ncbi:energy transducer TonB [Acetobacteroides hydrogenigenes]|uniref:TonB family protein n=1 Tax=Acetobacteroides hydrogenigenes TaxID=979970 RepID=A0A4R2EM55_9BACT|nr:energy transducer TonB [Acetobacteroides hydrogenigenes]TCN68466.1 TonB family protein [Acetobacteroides hydrogenigenes]
MKNLLTLTFALLSFVSYGQDTTYYDLKNRKVKSLNEAHYYSVSLKSDNNRQQNKKTYFKSSKIRSEKRSDKKASYYAEWYENGQLRRADTTNSKGDFNGQVLSYWENGVLKRNDFFKKGKLIKGSCYDKEGKEIEHYDYEVMPCFPGGKDMLMKYLASETKYPNICVERGIQGTVYVTFTINTEGYVSDIKIDKCVDPSLDAEALRVAYKMPKWNPGLFEGEPVNVQYTMPIKFSLQNSTTYMR